MYDNFQQLNFNGNYNPEAFRPNRGLVLQVASRFHDVLNSEEAREEAKNKPSIFYTVTNWKLTCLLPLDILIAGLFMMKSKPVSSALSPGWYFVPGSETVLLPLSIGDEWKKPNRVSLCLFC